ncbi:MAG: DegT/DnrJ/EryC1/StrS family aminotransferase [Tannerella sp.]|jgi:dTDP-4-amino-4,6-dideoxygalactose transaminase|nr:DegT/DnrJ/EryC1/StrS family aminotransferase [Tannerella sp.]
MDSQLIQMVDLSSQYLRLKEEIDSAVQDVFKSAEFINGAPVKSFCERLSSYMNVPYVIPCGNGTDALRIVLQALQIGPENDVIVPAFTYIAPIEAIASVGASPIVIDVDPKTFNINPELIERAITARTKAIIVVHLFGQACDMEAIQKIADKYKLIVIEDNAQSLGASYIFNDGQNKKLGTTGKIGITSFFPTKPLACYGDGGAIFTSDSELAEQIRLLANHGQTQKYHHKIIGCNSRLDTVQAAILNVKLNYMDEFTKHRIALAERYDQTLKSCPDIILPEKCPYSTHVYHQYTIQVKNKKRDALKSYLAEKGIPSMIYYPLPVHEQEGYKWVARLSGDLTESKRLCDEVLSLPIHSEMTEEMQTYIIETIGKFFFE